MADGKLPDFIIIGAMKCATTSLYWWLAEQPETFLAFPKETNFFSSETVWRRGPAWYADLFSAAENGRLLGEASVSYTSPQSCSKAAARMARVIPDARLIYLVRDPIERLRSHYRHEIQRNRESRPLLEAIRESAQTYVGHSLFFRCLRPYLDAFPREQICVVRFEDLVVPPHQGWQTVLRHLGVPSRPAPGTAHNQGRDQAQWTPALRWLKERGIVRFAHVSRLPRAVRRMGRRLLMRSGPSFERMLDGSLVDLPDALTESIWEDARQLADWLGTEGSLWPHPIPVAPTARDDS